MKLYRLSSQYASARKQSLLHKSSTLLLGKMALSKMALRFLTSTPGFSKVAVPKTAPIILERFLPFLQTPKSITPRGYLESCRQIPKTLILPKSQYSNCRSATPGTDVLFGPEHDHISSLKTQVTPTLRTNASIRNFSSSPQQPVRRVRSRRWRACKLRRKTFKTHLKSNEETAQLNMHTTSQRHSWVIAQSARSELSRAGGRCRKNGKKSKCEDRYRSTRCGGRVIVRIGLGNHHLLCWWFGACDER